MGVVPIAVNITLNDTMTVPSGVSVVDSVPWLAGRRHYGPEETANGERKASV